MDINSCLMMKYLFAKAVKYYARSSMIVLMLAISNLKVYLNHFTVA